MSNTTDSDIFTICEFRGDICLIVAVQIHFSVLEALTCVVEETMHIQNLS